MIGLSLQGIIAEKSVKTIARKDINHRLVLLGNTLSYIIKVTAQTLLNTVGLSL